MVMTHTRSGDVVLTLPALSHSFNVGLSEHKSHRISLKQVNYKIIVHDLLTVLVLLVFICTRGKDEDFSVTGCGVTVSVHSLLPALGGHHELTSGFLGR